MSWTRQVVFSSIFAVGGVLAVLLAVRGGMALVLAMGAAAVLCALVISRTSLGGLGVLCASAFAFTASYDDKILGVASPRQLLLLLAGAILLIVVASKQAPRIPWWISVFAGAAVAVTFLQLVFPISPDFLSSRYELSSFGQSLGERASPAHALASFLLNVLGVPLVVILATMYRRRALFWIIVAYVAGVCLSGLAGFLGFIGQPILLVPMDAVIPPNVRALGYTSFPLRFGTTLLFALPMACWLAGRRESITKWGGRGAIVVLLLGIYSSGSRAAVVSAIVCLGLAVLFLPALRRRSHVIASSVALGFAVVIWMTPALGDTLLQTTRLTESYSTVVSDQGRGEVFTQGIADFKESPLFGIGIRFIAEAHLTYLGVLAAGGGLFFVAFLLLNLGATRSALTTAKADPALGGMLLTSIGTALAYWLVGIDFAVASVQTMYGVIAAAAVATRSTGPAHGEAGVDVDLSALPKDRWLAERTR